MEKKMKWMGAALLGVLLVTAMTTDVVAKSSGWLMGNTLRIASTEGRDGTAVNTLGAGDAYIQDTLEVGTAVKLPAPAVQALGAGFTITADACGGVKLVSAAGTYTSDTTNTLTAAATAGKCKMLVINTGVNEILLDFNTEFTVGAGSAASLRLAKGGSITVYSDGTNWWHTAYTEY